MAFDFESQFPHHQNQMKYLRLAVLLLVSVRTASPQSNDVRATSARLWGDLRPGKYSVGFRTLFLRDTSRSWSARSTTADAHDPGRPIIVNVWYPIRSADSGGVRMVYGDYLHYAAPLTFRKLADTLEKQDRATWLSDVSELTPDASHLVEDLFSTTVASYRDAKSATGSYPLIIYASGLRSRSDANAILAEYLASHGYVVASLPQLGPSDTALDLGSSPQELLLREQDLEFAWAHLRTLENVDRTVTGIIGHSAGGIVALLFAMRIPSTRAVVSLDGSYGTTEGSRNTLRVPGFDSAAMRASLLDLRRDQGVQEVKLDSAVFESLVRSDRYIARFRYMWHGDFTEYGEIARIFRLPLPAPAPPDGRTRETGYVGNQHAYRAALDFLDFVIRGDRHAQKAMVNELTTSPGVVLRHVPPAK
jgi:dienelactone hydrolase